MRQTDRQACQTAKPNYSQTYRPGIMQDTLMQVQGIMAARRRLDTFRYDQICALQRRAATLYARNSRHHTLRPLLKKLTAAVDRWVEPYHRRRGVGSAFVSYFDVYRHFSGVEKAQAFFDNLKAARDRSEAAGDWEAYVNYDNLVEFIRPFVEPDEEELLQMAESLLMQIEEVLGSIRA